MNTKQEQHKKQVDTKHKIKTRLMKWKNLQDCIDWKYNHTNWIEIFDHTSDHWWWMCFNTPVKAVVLLDRVDCVSLVWDIINWCFKVPFIARDWKRFEEIENSWAIF